jgi:hypothetical protein
MDWGMVLFDRVPQHRRVSPQNAHDGHPLWRHRYDAITGTALLGSRQQHGHVTSNRLPGSSARPKFQRTPSLLKP